MQLTPITSIRGFVTDTLGNPVQSALAFAVAPRGVRGNLETVGELARTDDRGEYTIEGLAPGRYSVAVVPSDQETTSPMFAVSFFGTKAAPAFFETKAGEQFGNANVRVDIDSANTGSLIGKIARPAGNGLATSATVLLFDRQGLAVPIASGVSSPDGSFGFQDIPGGDYLVAAWTPNSEWNIGDGIPASAVAAGTALVSIAAGMESHADIELTPVTSLEGSLRTASPCAAIDHLILESVALWPGRWSPTIAIRGSRFTATPIIPGDYQLRIGLRGRRCRLSSISMNGSQHSSGATAVLHFNSGANLEFALSGGVGDLSGQVAPAGHFVVLSRADPVDDYQRVEPVEANGRYLFTDVPAGRYRVTPLMRCDAADYLDHRGHIVEVLPGQKLEVNLTLEQR